MFFQECSVVPGPLRTVKTTTMHSPNLLTLTHWLYKQSILYYSQGSTIVHPRIHTTGSPNAAVSI